MVVYPKPLGAERTEHFECFAPGETLGAYVRRVGITVPSRVVRVEHNGREVPLTLWQRLIPRHGDLVVISARGLGGGGGGKVLRTVAMLAVVVAAVAIPGAGISGLFSGFGLTGTSLALASAGIMIGGSLLVNALLPPLTPTAEKLGIGGKYESSPTYAISGGRNRARDWEPMLLVFGRHKVVADLGATPYTQQQGDDQYLNQIFHFGLQNWDVGIEDLRIGDTSLFNYSGVQTQLSDGQGRLTMFPGNVDTLQGFTLNASDGWQGRTTGANVTHLSVELAARLFKINDDGLIVGRSVDVEVQYRKVGTPDWLTVAYGAGLALATHYWSLKWRADSLGSEGRDGQQLDFGSTNPADHNDGDYVHLGGPTYAVWRWVPHPAALGQPWQGIAPDPVLVPGGPYIRLIGSRQEPTRQTVAWDVPLGQYEVRVRKITGDVNDSRESNETAVAQILVFQQDNADYTGQCRMALRIKASGQLNGQVDQFSATVIGYCLAWDGATWAYKATSNPAWWFLWFARGKRSASGSRIYGCGLTDAGIDIEGIKAWGAWCDAKGLTFDYVLDRKMSQAAVLQMIARAGRATMTYQTGRLGVIWDAAALPVTAMFGPFNVKAGSFKVAYMNDGTVDEVVLNFVNKDNGWAMDEVRARVPGVAATNNPLQLDLDGCTNKDMAGREANLIAAAQMWRRRKITWETDIEGLVCSRGDVVSFSHDLTEWGYSGRLMPGSGGTLMRLQKVVPSDGSGTVMLRDPDGNMKVVTVSSDVGDVDELTIVTDLDGFPMPGDEGYEDCSPFDWAWQFDPLATPGRRFKVSGVVPAADGLRFEATDDDPEYYGSESDPYQYTPPRDGALLGGVVFNVTFSEAIRSVANDDIAVQIGWSISTTAQVVVNVTVAGVALEPVTTSERRMTVSAKTGDRIVATVRPSNLTGLGTPSRSEYTVQGLLAPLPAVTGLASVFRDGLTTLVWSRANDVRQPDYEVRIGSSWTNSRAVGTTQGLDMLAVGNGLYFVAARFRLGSRTIYGPADSLLISGAVLVRNVLAVIHEEPSWSGSLEGGAFIHDDELTLAGVGDILSTPDALALEDVLWFGGVVSGGVYTTEDSNIVDIGYVAPVRIDFDIDEYALNFSEDILGVADVLAEVDVLNDSNRQHYQVLPQIQFALDDGVYGGWQSYVPGTVNARYFRVRLVLQTDDALIVPFVRRFVWTIDVPDLVQSGTGVAAPASGMRVNFPKNFHAKPNLQVTLLDAQAGDRAVIQQVSDFLLGFDIQIFNNATPVERVFNWLAQGY
ncbi:hypothetical protein EGU64_12865 [Achromobacter denitrificans]|nr:hypothetical protein EGU64_12865 [Achromobacter denitrificans]